MTTRVEPAQPGGPRPGAAERAQLVARVMARLPRAPFAPAFALPRAAVQARVRAGVPLLHEQPLALDVHFAADLLLRLAHDLLDLEGCDQPTRTRLQRLIDVAERGGLDWHVLVTEAFVQHADHVAELAAGAGVDAELLVDLAHDAVAPVLHSFARHLEPLLTAAADGPAGVLDAGRWQAGYCPICGSWPSASEHTARDAELVLRCGACGCAWRAPGDGACPLCGEVGAWHVDAHREFAACERCRGFLPLTSPSADPWPVVDARLEAAAGQARAAGYRQPAGAGFVIELGVPEDEWAEELG